MILKIEFENFFSIRDRVRIDFRAASINTAQARELSHNVMEWKGVPVLKTVGLFGPNASGKSNILKTITFYVLNYCRPVKTWKRKRPMIAEDDSICGNRRTWKKILQTDFDTEAKHLYLEKL